MRFTTLNDALLYAEGEFMKAGIYFGHGTDNPWDEACAIARFVLDLPPDAKASVKKRVLSETEKKRFLDLVNRRITERIPVPYLTHEAWFGGLKFYVDERVIIPRSPLAETIENRFQPWFSSQQAKKVGRILDLCTGSGCIAILCAAYFPEAKIEAVDISKEALAVAAKNVALHHKTNQITLIESNLFDACHRMPYDIIISNPPYVDSNEMARLPAEFRFEPELALAAGKDGLDLVRRIIREAPHYLSDSGLLLVEVGYSEAAMKAAFPHFPFTWLTFARGGSGVFLLKGEEKSCWAIS